MSWSQKGAQTREASVRRVKSTTSSVMIRGTLSRRFSTGGARVLIRCAAPAGVLPCYSHRLSSPVAQSSACSNRISTGVSRSPRETVVSWQLPCGQQYRALSYEFLSKPGGRFGGRGFGGGGGGSGGLDLWPITHANTLVNVCPQVCVLL